MTEAMPFLRKAILLSYDPRPFGRGFSLPKRKLFHRALVGLDHLLERVARTAFGIGPPLQLLQVFFGAVAGENPDVQPHGAVLFRGDEDFVDKGVDKLLGNGALPGAFFRGFQSGADFFHVCPELPAGLLLFPEFRQFRLRRLDFLVALGGHALEVRIGNTVHRRQLQQLAFLFQRYFNGRLGRLHLLFQIAVRGHGAVHPLVFLQHGGGDVPGIPEHVKKQGDDFAFVNREGVAGVLSVVDFPGADPFAVSVALLVPGFPPIIRGAAVGAEELAGQEVCVVADTLAVFHVLAAAAKDGVGLFPQFLGNNGRDDLAAFVLEHDPFFRRQEFLLFGEHIHHLDLVPHIIALVFGIGNHIGHGGMGNFFTVQVPVALVPEQGFNLLHGVFAGGVKLEQFPHHGGLVLVDDQALILLAVAENPVVAQHHAVFDGLLVAEFYPAGQFSQLILGDGGHDGQPQLRVLVEGIDVVVLEKDADPVAQKLAGKLDGVQGIAGETGDFLGNYQVKFVLGRVVDHAVEVFPAFGGDAGQALVDIPGHKGPGDVFLDEILVILNLVAQGV